MAYRRATLDFSKASEVDEVEGAIEGSVLVAFGGKDPRFKWACFQK